VTQREELGKLIKESWDKFLNETPRDQNWLKIFDSYMETNKELYSTWNNLRKQTERNKYG